MQTKFATPKSRSEAVRNVMRANKGVNTEPETRLRSLVHKSGLRYAINVRPEPDINRKADLVFRTAKVAVFVHGCFWHGCPEHYKRHKINRGYWQEKVRRNRERDLETLRLLRRRGWKSLVVWEHQDLTKAAIKIRIEVTTRRRKRGNRRL